ncbi:MAG: hypothetical protein K5697_11770 [Lachnospiraceae bacterium]|nr:hypothetical protein [Lachnospiraceae bacterium]
MLLFTPLLKKQERRIEKPMNLFSCGIVERRKKYHPTEQLIRHVDEVLKLLRVMTKDENIDQLLTIEKKEGGHGKMESYFTVMYKKGAKAERKEVNDLIRWLMEQGRMEELKQSVDDPELQDRLMEEMHEAKGDLVTV